MQPSPPNLNSVPTSGDSSDRYVALGQLFASFLEQGRRIYDGTPPGAPGGPPMAASTADGRLPITGSVVVSGAALMAFVSIHLWVSLTELPIEAAKSGERVADFLWFDILFVLFVVGHAFIGLYRITVKWGLLSRRGAYAALATLTAVVLAVEFAIVSSFFTLGGGQ